VHSFVLFEEGKDERQIEQMLRAAMRNKADPSRSHARPARSADECNVSPTGSA
jgi:hypothetical protein